ncbi:Imm1 family immunity protein [Amycolatopsis sp. NPDC059027]|uniref:Imm1 family immunity protein n=1 Tax=unclassified Amycolatopsis TaxID=2618356 RepID=UPI00366BDFA1
MVEAVDAWFDSPAQRPVVVHTAAELDAVLDQVAEIGGPRIVQFHVHGEPRRGLLDVGLDAERERGVLHYAGGEHRKGCYSLSAETASEAPIYFSMGGASNEFPANAELPLADVRRAAHEFMASGARPVAIDWQPRG